MTKRFLMILGVLILSSLACNALQGDGEIIPTLEPVIEVTAFPTPGSVPSPTPAPPIAPAMMTPQGPGMACIGSRSGLTCLDEQGWQVYNRDNSGLPSNALYAGDVCADGRMLIASISGLSVFDGQDWLAVPENEAVAASPEGVACAPNGDLWVAHFQGLSRYSNGVWTTISADALSSGESFNELVYDVEATADGKVWVLTSRSVALIENELVTVYQEGQGFDEARFFGGLTMDALGRPWAVHSSGVDVFEDGAWRSIQTSDFSSPENVTVDARGHVWYGTLSSGAWEYDLSFWSQHSRANNHLLSDRVNAITADSSGRVWIGTSFGLSVYDGSTWQSYLMSDSGLGDNDARFILVVRDGPPLPEKTANASASLTGALESADGTPLPGMRVEICVETLGSSFSGETPCSDQPFFLSTQSNSDGVFLFENVPSGYYVIVAETGSGWAQLTDQFGIGSERVLIEAGMQLDIGTLTLEEE